MIETEKEKKEDDIELRNFKLIARMKVFSFILFASDATSFWSLDDFMSETTIWSISRTSYNY